MACDVDLLRPTAGLLNLSVDSVPPSRPDLKILEIHTGDADTGSTVVDAFVRGTDLVVTYGETLARSARSQIYWRSIQVDDQVFGVDVILSVQTNKLDEIAALETSSIVPTHGEQLFADSSNGSLHHFALPSGSHIYTEMAHPSNLASTSLKPARDGEHWRLSHRFFPGSLEKGVIHRAILRAVLFTSDHSPQLEQLHAEFLDAPPPLST